MGLTPDEKFLVQLYKMAKAEGNLHLGIDFHQVAFAIGQKETAAKNMVKHLAQANLVEKLDDQRISLTIRGCRLVETHF